MDNEIIKQIVSNSVESSVVAAKSKFDYINWWDQLCVIVSAIPLVGGSLAAEIQSIKDSAADYKAYEFFRKFTGFICELGDLSDKQRAEFFTEVERAANDASGNVIMGLVDRLDNINKEKILANLVIAKGKGEISIEDLFRLSSMLERITYVDLAKLELYNQDYYDDEGDSELLFATGALQQSVIDEEDGNRYVLSKLGRKLLKYGLRVEVSDSQPRGTKVASLDFNEAGVPKPGVSVLSPSTDTDQDMFDYDVERGK